MDQQEQQLVEAAKYSQEAFGQLFDLYYKRVFNFCLKRTANVQLAEDLTSDIFFKVLHNLKSYKNQGAPFGAWLFRIANNELCSYFRKNKIQISSFEQLQESMGFDVAGEGTASSQLIDQEIAQEKFASYRLVNLAIQNLPEEYKETLALRYFEKRQINEIAEILDKKEGTVKSLLFRGVSKLRQEMERLRIDLQPKVASSVVINEDAK